MQKLKLRRLFDIKTEHVSLVDRAANMRQFLIVKRKENEKGGNEMEIIEVLQKIEDSLNDLNSRIDGLENKEVKFTFDTTEVEKKGARFSKETLASLRSLKEIIDKLLGEQEEQEKEEDEISREEFVKAVIKGIQESFKKEKKSEKSEDLTRTIANAVKEALKTNKNE